MTALAGFWNWGGGEPLAHCSRILAAQKLYGPHATASFAAGEIALGRSLYRLLPEDAFDRGPVQAASGNLLVADVRLDNRDELGDALAIDPPRSRMLSDADIVMHALDRWGEQAIGRLIGDFALAFWDARRHRLLLARDFSGQRPLVYHRSSGFFAFASMAKGLHALSAIHYGPNPQAMADFTALLPENGSETFFEGIEKVMPGYFASITKNAVTHHRYWNPSLQPVQLKSPEDYAEALREKFDAAVGARLRRATGDVGTQLSGGLDSSSVTATAARLLTGTSSRMFAFTSVPREGYDGPGRRHAINDERELASATAALYPNIQHVEISARASPLAALERGFFLYERPILNLANWGWISAINSAARERGLSIMLTGRMGNLSFSWDGLDLLPRLLASGRWASLARHVGGLRAGGVRWGTIASQTLGPFLPRPLWMGIRRLRGLGGVSSYSLINPTAFDELAIGERAEASRSDLAYQPSAQGPQRRLWALGRVDFGNYQKGILAEWGIDYRDPTGDRRVVEFCLAVPREEYLRDGVPRALARRAFADRLPGAVVGEWRKGYQAVDWHESFGAARDEVSAEIERIAQCDLAQQLLDVDRMKSLVETWPPKAWSNPRVAMNYRVALLRAISNGHFLRKVSGSNQ